MIKDPTQLMGILNVTPDSFFDASRFFDQNAAIERGRQMVLEGADILDIGGESTRPGADAVSEKEELERVVPVIRGLRSELSIPISIDTSKPVVAAAAIAAGANLINDVTGLQNPAMCEIAIASKVDVCLMHMLGNPRSMQTNPDYPGGIVPFLLSWFEERINNLIQKGMSAKHVIIDPGIGFGKTVDHNLEIIQNAAKFKELGFRLLIGISRKSFMGKILQKKSAELLPATLALNALLIQSQVDIIRVHDVREHRDVIDLLKQFNPL